MPRLGMGELVVILLIVVLLFGAAKLPQLGKSLGEGIRGFKKAMDTDEEKPSSGSAQGPGQGQGDGRKA